MTYVRIFFYFMFTSCCAALVKPEKPEKRNGYTQMGQDIPLKRGIFKYYKIKAVSLRRLPKYLLKDDKKEEVVNKGKPAWLRVDALRDEDPLGIGQALPSAYRAFPRAPLTLADSEIAQTGPSTTRPGSRACTLVPLQSLGEHRHRGVVRLVRGVARDLVRHPQQARHLHRICVDAAHARPATGRCSA